MNSGAGGDVLQGKIESGLMEQLEDVVQDAEDEAEFRNEHMIAGEDPEEDKIDDAVCPSNLIQPPCSHRCVCSSHILHYDRRIYIAGFHI